MRLALKGIADAPEHIISQREHEGALGPAGGSFRGCLVRPKPYGVLDLRIREILGRHGVKVAAA